MVNHVENNSFGTNYDNCSNGTHCWL